MFKSWKRQKFQQRFFWSYVLIMLLPLLMGTVVYRFAAKLLEQKELELQTQWVNHSMSMMDQTMEQIDSALIDLSRSAQLNQLLFLSERPDYRSPEAALVHSAYRELSAYTHSAGLDDAILLYIRNADLVFDGRSIVYGRENFYALGTSYLGISYPDFQSEILDRYRFRDTIGNVTALRKKDAFNEKHIRSEEGFLYLSSLPLIGAKNRILGTAVVHISSQVSTALSEIPASEYGSTYITDGAQNLLHGFFAPDAPDFEKLELSGRSGSFYRVIGGQKMLVSYAQSGYNGWYYISSTPTQKVMGALRSLQLLMIFISVGGCLCGLLLSALFSRRNGKPIQDALIRIQTEYGQELAAGTGDLNQSIQNIISKNREMQKSLKRQKSHARGSFFDSLLRGEFPDDREILRHAAYYGLEFTGAAYCCLLVTFGPASEAGEPRLQADIAQILTTLSIREREEFRAFHHTQAPGKQVILLCFREDRPKKNGQLLRELAQGLTAGSPAGLPLDACCFAGQIYKRLSDVCISYSEAAATLEAAKHLPSGRRTGFYDEAGAAHKTYLYPSEIKTKLRLLATGGDEGRTQEILSYLYEENFVKSPLGRHGAYAFLSDLYLGIVSIAVKSKDPGLFPERFYRMRLETLDSDEEFRQIRQYYRQIAAVSAGSVPEKNLIFRLESFIRENYHDPDISIAYMARQFHVSESYFSQFFKRHTGQVFSKYVETLRINRACDLLRSGKDTVDEIAAKIGYTNALSFRRAFKKVMGLSPSAYRQKSPSTERCPPEDLEAPASEDLEAPDSENLGAPTPEDLGTPTP